MGRVARVVTVVALVGLGLLTPVQAVGGQPAPPAEPTTTVPPTLPDGSPDVGARSWILVDVATGQQLAGANEHTPQLPASTVKLVTALTALRLLGSAGAVTVTDNAAARPAMRIGMTAGQVWPMTDALYCLLLVSANDAAYALAETGGGSLEGFAAQMAETGRELGMVDSTFADPAGFDDPADTVIGANQMSAWDLAVAGRAVLADPVLAPIVRTPRYDFAGPDGLPHTLPNHNKLLDSDPSVIGVKTGYTRAARGTFVAAAERGGRRLLGVVMGTEGDIYTPMNRLFDYGFALPAGTGRPQVLPAVVDATATTTPVAPTTAPPSTQAPPTLVATTVAAALGGGATTLAPGPNAPTSGTAVVVTPAARPGPVASLVDGAADPEAAALNGTEAAAAPVVMHTGGGLLDAWPVVAVAAGAGVAAAVGVSAGRRQLRRRRRRRRNAAVHRYLEEARR